MASNPIFKKTIPELIMMVQDDIHDLELEYPEYDIYGRRRNKYKAHEYANKLRDFLTLEYFKGGIYKYVGDIVGNLKFWANDSEDKIVRIEKKLSDVKRIKKLKGQVSFFDEYMLSKEEIENAVENPDTFIKELKEKLDSLERDKKLARFCLAYLMRHNEVLRAIYE